MGKIDDIDVSYLSEPYKKWLLKELTEVITEGFIVTAPFLNFHKPGTSDDILHIDWEVELVFFQEVIAIVEKKKTIVPLIVLIT